jgi:hypothetical protein
VRRAITAAALAAAVALAGLHGRGPAPWAGSTDGRLHACGVVTEAGVTEHLAEYRARCGP